VIKANIEGLCVLINAFIFAIAQPGRNEMAEVFDGDTEVYEVVVKVVNTYDELFPVPYQISKS
ncbi:MULTISPECIES: hypothetical protein, partial [Nostoc]